VHQLVILLFLNRESLFIEMDIKFRSFPICVQESLANAKVRARQQCVYEGP